MRNGLLQPPFKKPRASAPLRAGAFSDCQRIVGMTYSAPARMPVGQRDVIVFSRV